MLAHFSTHSFSQFLRGRWCKGSSSSSSFLFFFFVLIFKDDCFPRVSQFVVEKFVREREDENNQEEVVKSQSALHVAHFGSTLAKFFWLET